MRDPLTIVRNLDESNRAQRENDAREKEAKQFDLAQLDYFLGGIKYIVFGVLGALNIRLFWTVVPGAWGIAIALTAAAFEVFAVYCWNKQRKAGGEYQAWLFRIAIVFTAISVIHSCASFYDLTRAVTGWPSLGYPLYIYSHVVAFPLLFLGMIVAVCVLYRKHWSKEVADAQAKTAVEMAKNRGQILNETARMRNEEELSRARLANYEERLKIQQAFLLILQDVVKYETRAADLLSQIPDPTVRQRMADLLGKDSNADGTPDILQNPAIVAQARELLAASANPTPPSRMH